MLLGQPIRQIAYCVDDIETAAHRHASLFGSGPFFVMDIPDIEVTYRGQNLPFNHVAAVGQWGEMQVEFIQQHDDGPSIVRELYPAGSGRTGLHHVALFVDNLQDALAQMKKAGFDEAGRMGPKGSDIVAVFIDAVTAYGHFIELYEPKPALKNLYDMVAKASVGFTGQDLVRRIKF